MELKKKTIIWEDNNEPPKDYIWAKKDGKFYEYSYATRGWIESKSISGESGNSDEGDDGGGGEGGSMSYGEAVAKALTLDVNLHNLKPKYFVKTNNIYNETIVGQTVEFDGETFSEYYELTQEGSIAIPIDELTSDDVIDYEGNYKFLYCAYEKQIIDWNSMPIFNGLNSNYGNIALQNTSDYFLIKIDGNFYITYISIE